VTWSWAPSVCVLCTLVPGHSAACVRGWVCNLRDNWQPQCCRDMARYQVTSRMSQHANYNHISVLPWDRVNRLTPCIRTVPSRSAFFIVYIGLGFQTWEHAIIFKNAVSTYNKETTPLTNRLMLFR
jgi:hypothetical protein